MITYLVFFLLGSVIQLPPHESWHYHAMKGISTPVQDGEIVDDVLVDLGPNDMNDFTLNLLKYIYFDTQ